MSGVLLAATLLAGALAVIWVGRTLRVVVSVGAGYKAKVLCTALFGSRRAADPHRDDQISAESYRILRAFRVTVDREHRRVTASFWGLVPRTAVHRDGLGTTLQSSRSGIDRSGAVAVPGHRPTVTWQEATGSAALLRVVDAAFDEPTPTRKRRTQAVIVIQDGRIVAERYAPGISQEMPLPGWSMAKSVLSALVGVLVDDGRLTLDSRELLPEWSGQDPRAAITLDDLLRMRSGLRFSEAYANPWSDVLHMLYDCDDAAGYAASRQLADRPGRTWQYSSGTSNILSLIVRRTVGETAYPTWPRRVLFDRCRMSSAVLEPDASGTFICSSYMLATARDWAAYGQLWLDEGRGHEGQVLSTEWVGSSTTATPQSPDGRYGAHWWLKLNPDIGGDSAWARSIAPDTYFAVGHEGQTLTVMPSRRAVVVRLGASIHIDAWNQARFIAELQDTLR